MKRIHFNLLSLCVTTSGNMSLAKKCFLHKRNFRVRLFAVTETSSVEVKLYSRQRKSLDNTNEFSIVFNIMAS